MRSGLYDSLVDKGWLIPHVEIDGHATREVYRTLQPQVIPYVSYPYEWCFSQLKDAALLTLDIQILSLSMGMELKDASAYNVQFIGTRPVFIDTLSFQRYEEGMPWIAYRQFCQHFLVPLALMAHRDSRLGQLSSRYIDGITLDLAARLLPRRTRARYGLLTHVHLHSLSQRWHRTNTNGGKRLSVPRLSKLRLIALVESLRASVRRLRLPKRRSEWSDYYDETNYSADALSAKESLVRGLVDATADPADITHDVGANTGRFSRIVASPRRYVVSHDIDEVAVERNYLETKRLGRQDVLPLLMDLTNPSPAIGWGLEERSSALERMGRGTVIALALVHHLAISHNIPLPLLAGLLGRIANTLIIEFVPKEDSQVRRLLARREDIFPDYTLPGFVAAFEEVFTIVRRETVPETVRTLFAMRRRT